MALFQAVWVEAALAMVVLVVALLEAVLVKVVWAVTALEVVAECGVRSETGAP